MTSKSKVASVGLVGAVLAVLLAWPATANALGPRAVITGGPQGDVASRDAMFTFTASSSAPLARFECRLDGAASAPGFEARSTEA